MSVAMDFTGAFHVHRYYQTDQRLREHYYFSVYVWKLNVEVAAVF